MNRGEKTADMQMHSHPSKIDLYIFSRRIAEIGIERQKQSLIFAKMKKGKLKIYLL